MYTFFRHDDKKSGRRPAGRRPKTMKRWKPDKCASILGSSPSGDAASVQTFNYYCTLKLKGSTTVHVHCQPPRAMLAARGTASCLEQC